MKKPTKPVQEPTETKFADHTVIVPPHRLRAAISRMGDSMEIETDAIMRAENALKEIKGEFRGWMNDECKKLEAVRAAIRQKGQTAKQMEELFRAAHDVRGHSAIFGYPLAGRIAGTLCRLISQCPDPSQIPPMLIDCHVDAVRAVVREGVHRENDKTGNEIFQRLAAMTEAHLAQFGKGDLSIVKAAQALPEVKSQKL